jgi:hypothetical protein
MSLLLPVNKLLIADDSTFRYFVIKRMREQIIFMIFVLQW